MAELRVAMWEINQTYIGASEQAMGWLRATSRPYYHLRPPQVPAPILAVADISISDTEQPSFAAWAQTARLSEPKSIRPALPPNAEIYGEFPDRLCLLRHKWLAEQTQTPVAVYAAQTWGGTMEYEWAWEFGPHERVLARAEYSETVRLVGKDWLFRNRVREEHRSGYRLHEFAASGQQTYDIANELAVLIRLLRSFGIDLSKTAGSFEPHTREFDWNQYRVAAGESR